VLVAPEPTVAVLHDLVPAAEILTADLTEVVDIVARGRVRGVVVIAPPGADVVDILRGVREARRDVHLLLVTAAGDWDTRLRALDAGVDDALPPIPDAELAERLASIVRRRAIARSTRLVVGIGIELDIDRRELLRDGRWVHLRPKEAGLLEVLARARGRALTRSHILERVWGPGHHGDPRTVDVHVRWLRAKIEPEPGRPRRLVTVRGVGYRLDLPEPSPGRPWAR
jgi:DNA-binding response OmpR family regulator